MSHKHIFITEIDCALPKDGFGDWEDMSEETQTLFRDGPIPCDGYGPSPDLCESCRFCTRYDVDQDDQGYWTTHA
jgi:hypothetical protein